MPITDRDELLQIAAADVESIYSSHELHSMDANFTTELSDIEKMANAILTLATVIRAHTITTY